MSAFGINFGAAAYLQDAEAILATIDEAINGA